MSTVVIALLIAVGIAAWIYSKLMRSTGGNTRDSIIVSAVLAVLIFALALFLANMFLPS